MKVIFYISCGCKNYVIRASSVFAISDLSKIKNRDPCTKLSYVCLNITSRTKLSYVCLNITSLVTHRRLVSTLFKNTCGTTLWKPLVLNLLCLNSVTFCRLNKFWLGSPKQRAWYIKGKHPSFDPWFWMSQRIVKQLTMKLWPRRWRSGL